ncbi:jerky protein homolog-like [Bombus pyrosoma]|uniref:jerky protein homolog-like n=1 Tax=Bombus pyrosoma TaxID=396416 RepID=UPI001CB91D18|nr:jerky protein homolog-like [Bombus pyrosoma]
MTKIGETQKALAEKYGTSEITIRNIESHRKEIITYFETSTLTDSQSTKYLRTSQRRDLERVLYQWCMRCKNRGIKLTGVLIRKTAREFNEKLYRDPNFKASSSLLIKFKHRHNICKTDIYDIGYLRTTKQTAADIFKIKFKELLNRQGYTLENVYNVDYTGLIWRRVPEETLMFHREESTASPKMYKDHVTILLCANATGCHKLAALVIAKFGDSQDSKKMNINSLSIMYEENSKALMDGNMFNKWFEKCFLKSVIKKQKRRGRREKILLMVDNARWDYNLDEAENKDEFVFVTCFPYHGTPLIQPTDCGIMECFKRMYRKELVETIMPLPIYYTQEEAVSNHKGLIMWDCCRMVQDAWSNVEDTILEKAWGKLLKEKDEQNFRERQIIEADIDKTVALLHELPGCQWCNTVDVKSWYEIDSEEKMFMKVCTDEVLRDFENNALD